MTSNGFIVDAEFRKGQREATEYTHTDLHVEDQRVGQDATQAGDSWIVEVWIAENGTSLAFDIDQAKKFVEAMQEIIDRYPEEKADAEKM